MRLLSVGTASQSKATLTNQDVLGRLAERILFATEIKLVASNMEFNEIREVWENLSFICSLYSVLCYLYSVIFHLCYYFD